MRKYRAPLVIAAFLLLVGGLALFDRPEHFHAVLDFSTPSAPASVEPQEGSLKFRFVFEALPSLQVCESVSGKVARTVLIKCPSCVIQQLRCTPTLTSEESSLLSDVPLPYYTGRMQHGAVSFQADGPELAQAACREAAQISARGPQPITCFDPDTVRPKPVNRLNNGPALQMAFLLVVTAAVISWVACWFIVKYEHLHAHLSHDHVNSGPQKVHGTLTPRIGGISLMAGLLAAGAVLDLLLKQPAERYFDLLLLSSLPAFLGGLTEDVTKRVHVIERLLLTMLSAAIAAWLIGAVLPGIGVPLVDTALRWQPLAIAFTVFAVGGVANATNIIDGFNGLSSGYALIVLLGLCVVAGLNRDTLVFAASLALAGALLGFFEWNWPNGRIFLGDGGAYLLGFLLAELSVLLVERNPAVSPWFPVLLLIYPVFETLFSMYRRHVVRGQSPGEPDGLHLHTLIYRRLVSRCDVNGQPRSRLARNNRVAKYFWGSASITAALACLFWQSTPALIAIAVGYCLCYTIFYRRIVHWKKTIHFLRLKNR